MAGARRQSDHRPYVEKWGMRFEMLGADRMMGRILGWLLISDPAEQTAKEIAVAIGASSGSISTATRSLLQAGMVERIGIPGKRSAHFRIAPGVWVRMLRARMAHTAAFRDLAEEGLMLVPTRQAAKTMRLREIQSYCTFIEKEFPALIARWEEEWGRER